MRQIFIILLFSSFFVSCTFTQEQKVNKLIKEEMNKTLVNIDSYDPVEMQIDSAFTPYDDPTFLNDLKEMGEESKSLFMMSKDAERAKSMMDLYEEMNMPYYRNQYLKNKEEYDAFLKTMKDFQSKWEKRMLSYKPLFDKSPSFVGYKVRHKYRYVNDSYQTVFGNMLFIIDKDMKHVLFSCDLESIEYDAIKKAINEIKEQRGEDW